MKERFVMDKQKSTSEINFANEDHNEVISMDEFIRLLVCETCPSHSHCYGLCINDEWFDNRYKYLKAIEKAIKENG